MKGSATTWAAAAPNYRRLLFVRGEKTDECPGIPREKVAEVLAKGGELSLCEILHCRVRYMSDGVAIGSRAFLERVFEANRSLFGKRRTDGPRPMKGGAAWAGLMTLRELRLAPIS
jgi:putative transposase